MLVITKILVLLYFTSTHMFDRGISIRAISTDINRYVEVIKTIGISQLALTTQLLEPSNYKKYYAGLKNEDIHLNGTQLIEKYGFPVEIHHVTTYDGYILTMYRIPCGGPPVFLNHGLLLSSDDFIIAGPENGLAYLLAKDGYDVWMGNARGSKYSRNHETLDPDKDSAFWNFSVNEIGAIDTPTMVDYVLNVTEYEKVVYIGHSQGTCVFLIMCSEHPEYNDKISLAFTLTIVAYVSNLKSPVFRAIAHFVDEEYFLYKHLGFPNEILPSNELTKAISGVVCGVAGYGIAMTVCTNIAFIFFGYDYSLLNITNIPNIARHVPAGSSTKQLLHFFQLVNSGNFQKFDYGKKGNIEMYNNEVAPHYDLGKVTAPIFVMYSENDWLVDVKDVYKTTSQLPNVVERYKIRYRKFNHLDYLWSTRAKDLVYRKISKVLNKYGLDNKSKKCLKK